MSTATDWPRVVVLQLEYNCGLTRDEAEALVAAFVGDPVLECSDNPYAVAEELMRERDRRAHEPTLELRCSDGECRWRVSGFNSRTGELGERCLRCGAERLCVAEPRESSESYHRERRRA